jgi:hypothetical protein
MGIEVLLGKTLTNVFVDTNGEFIDFETEDGSKYKMYHRQDCCENVSLEDVVGNIQDLIGSPILEAEESGDGGEGDGGTYTWTYYKLGTIKGHVNLRWYGSSNGYYSESVDFEEIK